MFTETIYLFSHTQHSEWCAPCTVHHYDMIVSNWIKKKHQQTKRKLLVFIYSFLRPTVAVRKKIRCCLFGLSFFFLAGLWKFRMNRLLHIFRTICRPIKMFGIYWCWHQHFKSQVFPYNRLIITAFATIVVWFCDCGLLSHWYRVSYPKTIAPTNTQR